MSLLSYSRAVFLCVLVCRVMLNYCKNVRRIKPVSTVRDAHRRIVAIQSSG